MAKLIYSAITSLDGYTEDEAGAFEWAMPDEEVHAFVNDLERPVGTYLYGRRMYETMMAWETDPSLAEMPGPSADFAQIWRAADKVVYSGSLEAASTKRTRIERAFNPDEVREMKSTADSDLSIGGPGIAAHAFRAGLVDECVVFVVPVIVGGGKPCYPAGVRLDLELADERRFGNGMVYLRYRAA